MYGGSFCFVVFSFSTSNTRIASIDMREKLCKIYPDATQFWFLAKRLNLAFVLHIPSFLTFLPFSSTPVPDHHQSIQLFHSTVFKITKNATNKRAREKLHASSI